MAEDLTTEQIVKKLAKQMPEKLIDEVLSYYADLISYAASLNNDAWNISNRESGKTFQINCGHMYILRSDDKKLLVMCDRDVVLSLSKDFINQLLSECTLKAYEDKKERDLQPKNYDELKDIPEETLWNNTFQFYIPYEVLYKYMPTLMPSIKKFIDWSINNSTLMQNSKDAHQRGFVTLINQSLGKNIKEPDYAHTSWVISSNPEYYDSVNAFRDLKTVDWKQSEKAYINVGDIVYVFISRKIGVLKFKCIVKEINIPIDKTIRDEKYVLDKDALGQAKFYMRLEKIKEFNGCAYSKDYMSLFGFSGPQNPSKLNSYGPQFISYLELIERLQNAKEIVPSEYDGSYELVTEVVKSYSKISDLSICDYNDLNLVYLATVGTWKHSIDKKKETVNKSNLPDNEKTRINNLLDTIREKANNHEYLHTEQSETISVGMFGTGFYNTQTKTNSEAVQKFIKLCISLLNEKDEEQAFSLVEDVFKDGMNGLATGGVSQILHCLKPYVFPILNSHQGKNNLFQKLGIQLDKVNEEKNYASNCRKIKEYRDSNFSWKNYRNFDIEDLNMEEVNNEADKKYLLLIDEYKKFFNKNKEAAFDNEVYKWELLTQYKGKKEIDLINAVRNSKNLIYPSDGATLKTLVEKVPEELNKIVNKLLDESVDILLRLANFNIDMKTLVKNNLESTNYAEDERTASDYLTYTDPEKYTFYTNEIYNSFCEYLGIEKKKTGEIYLHYCELLHKLESFVSKDNELLEMIAKNSSNCIQSNLLLAQNIVYVMLKEKFLYQENGDDTMSNKSKELIEYTELLRNKLNVILQGAPGTGKTYTTASLALSICGENLDYNDRDAVMKRYKELRGQGRIGFCTFHQSMDYEDFIEGLKPQSDGSDKVIYDVEDGLFKRICKKALEDGNSESDNFEVSLQKFVEKLNAEEKITIPTKTGKSFTVYLNQYGDGLVDEQPNYSRFYNFKQLYNVYRRLPGVPNKGHDNYRRAIIDYMQDEKNGIGLKQYNPSAQSSGEKAFVLIIDEINRGYVSKIFGELITLLETDKRLGNLKTELTVELPYSKETFGVPKNLYIIGTMNTTDRSTGTLDYAVRRRFAFVTLEAKEAILEETNACEEAKALFKDVKAFIENNKLEDIDIGDLMVGHSYFMTDKPDVLKQKIKYEVIPLVKEYIKDGILTCLTSEAKPYFDDWLELRVHDSQVSDIEQ